MGCKGGCVKEGVIMGAAGSYGVIEIYLLQCAKNWC